MPQRYLEVIDKQLESRKQDIIATIVEGGCKDFADYRHMCGLVRGLATAQMEANDLLRKMKDDDEN